MVTSSHTERAAGSLHGEPDYWVTVPGGPFIMGSDELRPNGRPSAAAPAHTLDVDTFRIGRGPLTVTGFAHFVAETGYVTTAERSGQSWVWHGGDDITTPDQDQLWRNTAGATWRSPRGPGSDVANKSDHPVTHVSYLDCMEYCRWSGTRLPTEAEWEKAARGTDGRRYTWGDSAPTPSSCNHTMHVGDTTPIGMYPDAAGPYGAQDMAGNVWEVMGNGYHRYPFDGDKAKIITIRGREIKLGVIRGGSFYNNCDPRGVLVWVRIYNPPDYSCYDMGFRVCAVS
ncbi:MAG TPA: SUMF1/EgtB/PvdO family nonheme iron enzyme [Streptosporangiaceae bacterium]|nr:SUMF1/EgtB/PvdO family nonheme iron enzyme [Streptosporangiaceae bacterium]